MKKPKAGIRSTSKKLKSGGASKLGMETADSDSKNETENTPTMPTPVIIPNDEPQANNIFCYATLEDKQQGTLYTDATGALPEISPDGKQYFFVAYDYDTNYIFALPIANVQDKTIIESFDKIFTELIEKVQKPTFNVTDNQAVTPLKKYLRAQNCRWQFVEPANHRVNADERAIQTFKNHFISGLCSTDSQWPT